MGPTNVQTIKALSEPAAISSVPSEYAFVTKPNDLANPNDPDHSIPIIDLSLLTCGSPQQRSTILYDLKRAFEDWGFFMVINHGVEERVMKGMLHMREAFFDLRDDDEKEFQGTADNVLDPIKCGTSSNVAIDNVLLWRDFIKVISHPHFNSPHKPLGFSEAAAISDTLGLEADYIAKATNWDEGLQLLAANYYPACPEPERAIGIPPHTDHGLVSLLIQNQRGGLQVLHKGKWVNWDAVPNSYVVILGDQMQVLTNDTHKSV
ncbi:2-oxoglutarate-dependent dioxygenase 19-like [Humulus lupulus]|uniref:2-oxoglutarate-dependent dioxygenase 19-like n=1 Tax=Humulus lupulus TaxID=3486 RepID=UPI002B4104FC|nr:2-oxoglutarate-dependent dioxygenase 19-like [Humulus lupulus]